MLAAVLECAHRGIHSALVAALVVAFQPLLSEVVVGPLLVRVLEVLGLPWAAAEDPDLILVYCYVSLEEAVGGLSADLKCLCDMGLPVASKLPLLLPTLAVSILA